MNHQYLLKTIIFLLIMNFSVGSDGIDTRGCFAGDNFSPDLPWNRDAIDIDSIEEKTVRLKIHTFSEDDGSNPLIDETMYFSILEAIRANFSQEDVDYQDTKIRFSGDFIIHNSSDVVLCNEHQDIESCENTENCYWQEWVNQDDECLVHPDYVVSNFVSADIDDYLNIIIADFPLSRAGRPWASYTGENRVLYLLVQDANNHVVIAHELGHKFGLIHIYQGVVGEGDSNMDECSFEDECYEFWDYPEFGTCDNLSETDCGSTYGCFFEDNQCWHEADFKGDRCSDTWIQPRTHNNCGNYSDVECNDGTVVEFTQLESNRNWMTYEYCRDHFTEQQIKRMHGWIEYNFPRNGYTTNLCGWLEDYECNIYGCTNLDATNYNEDSVIDDGSCVYNFTKSFHNGWNWIGFPHLLNVTSRFIVFYEFIIQFDKLIYI